MFTGIIQGIAKLISINKKPNFYTYITELPNYMLDGLEIGASISHNGCCLTVTKINGNHISFDLIKETLKITNLGKLNIGDNINVERAAKLQDEIGGHLMSGHIITTAKIMKILNLENNRQIFFRLKDLRLMKYILYKGFIGIDGVSLTISKVMTNFFCVYLIPETMRRTTLGTKEVQHIVNIEIDSQTQAIVDTVRQFMVTEKIRQKHLYFNT